MHAIFLRLRKYVWFRRREQHVDVLPLQFLDVRFERARVFEIATYVPWHGVYPLSLRHFEEVGAERIISDDQLTVHRYAIKLLPVLGESASIPLKGMT
ncbi:integrase [Pandoraea terrae]|uniref:Integrase n=1 Tax=Pandoraea terrae TaxID=1537710 RepID=A0A5E4U8B8_9BURK|nr:integrase [Pandoraea terrae]